MDIRERTRKQEALPRAAEEGDTDRVQQLLAERVNPNAGGGFLQWSPLSQAAYNGHHETVSALLSAGADVNSLNDKKWSPLHLAAYNGHHETVSVLLTAGADVNARTALQSTPLYLAAQNGHHETVSALLAAGADVNAEDDGQDSPLHMAAYNGHHETASVLLTAGANVNALDDGQLSPLHLAAHDGHHRTVSALLTAGADVNARDDTLRTSLHMAVQNGHHETVSALLAAGADMNAEDVGENTPLHDAATRGHPKCAEILLQYGADASLRNEVGRTAEDIATDKDTLDAFAYNKDEGERITRGRKEILKLLEDENNPSHPGGSSVPLEIQLRGPGMQQLYFQACRQGSRPMHSVRGLVVGQFRSGKTCVVRRLTGEKAVENEPITDGIEISPSVKTKTWRKAKEEPDEFKETMAERLAEQQEQKKARTQTSSQTQGAVRKKPTDAGNAQNTTREQTQQEKPPKKDTPKQSQQTPKLKKEDEKESGREESVATTTSRQIQPQQVRLGDSTVQQHKQNIPDEVITKARELLQGGATEEQLGTAEHPRLSLWDFGGQATYYGSHQCFFTYRGIYILVMSLLQKLSDKVPDLDYKAAADNLVTGRDYLDHWLNSVRTHNLVHGREQEGEPRVVLVLTHKDKVDQSDIDKYKKDIRDHISDEAAGKHVLPEIFVIDNFNEDNSDIDELREYLRKVAKGLWFMGQEVPMTWLHLKSKLMNKRREDEPFCRFQDVIDLARSDDVDIADDSVVADILTFLHDLGDIIFINEPVLRDHVTLRPQVMIDVFKTIITVPEYQQDRSIDGEVAEMWRRLEIDGILSDRLLTIIWTKADQKMQKPFLLRHKPFLKRLMEKYYLLCNATPIGGFGDTADKPEKEEIYFVPSLLAAKPDDSTLYPGHMTRCQHPLYVVFDNMFLPSGMFYRLQAICVRRFGFQESHVFAGCGRFPTDDVKQQFVVTKVKHYLKVEVLSAEAEDQTEFTEGLPVRKFLSSCLFEIKENWIPSIQYNWCFGKETGEETGTPVFHPLPEIEQEMATGSSRFPEDFINVWIRGRGDKTTSCAENLGGSGPVIIEPTPSQADKEALHTIRPIRPILDYLEACRGLSLAEVDRIRHELTSVGRCKELVETVNRAGDMCRRLLGASVEVCLPERAHMFLREERGDEIVLLHVGDYNDKLVQPLLKQLVQSSSRYGVTVSEDVVKPEEIITDKLLCHLLTRNVRMVVPIITPQTLHSRHWSTLGYEFCVQNKNLVIPVFAYPEGTRERLLEVLDRRCAGMLEMAATEVPMTAEPLSNTKISLTAAQILRKASSSVVLYTRQITAEGCAVVEDGVTIFFPKGCVKTDKFMSFEVDILPTDGTLANSFSAVTPVLTVHLDTEEDFLRPVTVTLPWTWKSTCDLGRTILMKRSTEGQGRQWSVFNTEVRETKDTITFKTCHFCSIVGAKKKDSYTEASTSADTSTEKQDEAANQEAPKAIEVLVTRYNDDKVHLIISPNEATTDNRCIHLLCIEKGIKVTEVFRADNFKTPPPFQQVITLHKEEKIRVRFDEEEDVIGNPRDIPPEPLGIQFVFPRPLANCNTKSVRLRLRDPKKGKGKFEGAVHFTLLSKSGEPVPDPIRQINSAFVYLHSLQDQRKAPKRRSSQTRGPSDRLALAKKARRDGVAEGRSDQVSVSLPFSQAVQTEQEVPSVLLVNDKYGTSHEGTSTTSRQVAQFLNLHGATVHATALQASEEDKQCATEDGVILHLPVQSARQKKMPTLEWLTDYHIIHYPNIPQDLKCIVGHADFTSEAAKSIQENRCQQAKLVLFNHDMPEETEYYRGAEKAMAAGKKLEDINEDAKNADAVFSLGRKIYEYFKTKYKSNETIQHFLFLPRPSQIFEDISVRPGGGQKVVLFVGRVTEGDKLKGHDLVARAMGDVAQKVTNVGLRVRGIGENDWEESKRILEENLHSGKIKPTLLPCGTLKDIAQDMQQAHLLLMPSRAEPFGLIGLEAIAAGIPVLISDKSGLADMIMDLIKEEKCHPDMRHRIVETSVRESDLGEDAKEWAKKIVNTLNHSKHEFDKAAEFKKKLLESKYWEEHHQNLLRVCGLTD
ncbi:PREDICTED: uncharacterized protein LOC109470229 [Branchiostoma belcheri]|uniref:Uncharacterized protein LOC109470229 n=1 Tax=Branchiostoma belcheri TaxID=7741 RepID=A0A6P4YSD7_BRABE|nr:PREDICTED: uncharacterized protein LOC109470229 [Branchiostoma belcheri]